MNNNSLLYKIGLAFSICMQAISSIIVLIATLVFGIASEMEFVDFVFLIPILIFFVVSLTISSLTLNNLIQSEKGEVKFNRALMITAGAFSIFTTIIGAILIFIGLSDVNGEQKPSNTSDSEHSRSYQTDRGFGGDKMDDERDRDRYSRDGYRDDRKESKKAIDFYKGSLIFAIALQVCVLLITISFGLVGFGIYFGISIAPLTVASLALYNLIQTEKGEAKFNKDLALASGILSLFVTILGGILVLVSLNGASERLINLRKRNSGNYRDDREFRNERSERRSNRDFRDDREFRNERSERRSNRDFRDDREFRNERNERRSNRDDREFRNERNERRSNRDDRDERYEDKPRYD